MALETDTSFYQLSIEDMTFEFGMIIMSICLFIIQRHSLIIFWSFQMSVCSYHFKWNTWSHDICTFLFQKQTDVPLFAITDFYSISSRPFLIKLIENSKDLKYKIRALIKENGAAESKMENSNSKILLRFALYFSEVLYFLYIA